MPPFFAAALVRLELRDVVDLLALAALGFAVDFARAVDFGFAADLGFADDLGFAADFGFADELLREDAARDDERDEDDALRAPELRDDELGLLLDARERPLDERLPPLREFPFDSAMVLLRSLCSHSAPAACVRDYATP